MMAVCVSSIGHRVLMINNLALGWRDPLCELQLLAHGRLRGTPMAVSVGFDQGRDVVKLAWRVSNLHLGTFSRLCRGCDGDRALRSQFLGQRVLKMPCQELSGGMHRP